MLGACGCAAVVLWRVCGSRGVASGVLGLTGAVTDQAPHRPSCVSRFNKQTSSGRVGNGALSDEQQVGAAGLAHALRTNWPSRTDQLPASSSLFLPYTHKHAKTHGTPRAGGRGKRRNWSKGNPIVIQAEDGERVKVQRGAGEMPAVHGLGRKSPTPLASTVTHPPPPVSSASPKGPPRNRGSRGSRGRGRGGGGPPGGGRGPPNQPSPRYPPPTLPLQRHPRPGRGRSPRPAGRRRRR